MTIRTIIRNISVVGLCCTPFIAGCLAFGSEAMAAPSADGDFWLSLVKMYGPMAGMLIWFMQREKTRDALVVDCAKAITNLNATLTEYRKDMEKMRLALYQVRDEARGKRRKAGH
ncbi:MAG: hypothetical protein LUC93_17645 [Planctomycetaceae bacterium]|nr:hypothetical protein [Planctomycetaceae bacterium]